MSTQAKRTFLDTPRLVRVAGACSALGIALSISESGEYGRWLTVLGVLLLIAGLHRFGRSGPDAAIQFEVEPPARKRKKKKPAPSQPTESAPRESD